MSIPKVQAPKARAIQRKRLPVLAAFLLHRELHEHKVEHVPNTVERQALLLLPHRVEPVVLHDARLARHRARGRRGHARARRRRRRVRVRGRVGQEGRVRPVRDVDRDLDERVEDGLVDDLPAFRVLGPRQLLGGDDLRDIDWVKMSEGNA